MRYKLLIAKRLLEDLFMFPLILTGRFIARLKPLQDEYKVFYFFPFYHTGGAEKVHSMIAQVTGGSDCIIFFTKQSNNTALLQKFRETDCVIKDISKFTGNKWLYPFNIIYRGILSGYINKQSIHPVVFNGQCNFGYKLSPWLKRDLLQIELIHSVSNFSCIRIPFLPFISRTVMISRQKIAEHLAIYRRCGIPEKYDERISYIPNATEFLGMSGVDKNFDITTVFYSGRATFEKRPNLVIEIAKAVHAIEPNIVFNMAGDNFVNLRNSSTAFIRFLGNITDENQLQSIYARSQIILITSSTEGFPLAVVEGMMYGNAIIATPVGDLILHIKSNENGFLLSSVANEKTIIQEGVDKILRLHYDKALLRKISQKNTEYAKENFSLPHFERAYRKIFSH